MTGFVYAIGSHDGPVKIGWSTDPVRRRDKIGSDCPTEARLLGLVPATKQQEKELHKLLLPWRYNREWYRVEGAVLHFLKMLPAPAPRLLSSRRMVPKHNNPICQHRAKHGLTLQELGNQLGVSHATLSRYESGVRMPSARVLRLLSRVTGISIQDLRPDFFGDPASTVSKGSCQENYGSEQDQKQAICQNTYAGSEQLFARSGQLNPRLTSPNAWAVRSAPPSTSSRENIA